MPGEAVIASVAIAGGAVPGTNANANWRTKRDEAHQRQIQARPPHGRERLRTAKSPVNRREYGPGQHGQRRKSKVSDYGIQLRAKQKLKGYYGDITEKQFKKNYTQAIAMKGDASQNLIGLLEQRLDMVVYRAKFAPTIWAARQLVNHGHLRVNGVKCNIASRRVNVGDVVELGAKAQEMALVIEAQSLAERDIPDYVVPDGTSKITFSRVPKLDEVPYPVRMEPNLVIEFYSR